MYRAVVIVTAADREAARTIWANIDPMGANDTFTSGLSSDGSDPPSHYVCSSAIKESDIVHLETLANTLKDTEIILHIDNRMGDQSKIDIPFRKEKFTKKANPRAVARVERLKKDPHTFMSEKSLQVLKPV